MTTSSSPERSAPWSGAFFSLKYFLARALAIGVLFLVAHLAGLRDFTTFVTGTAGSPEVSFRLSAFYGMIYLVLYMGCVVLAPILVLAAGLIGFWTRYMKKSRSRDELEETNGGCNEC